MFDIFTTTDSDINYPIKKYSKFDYLKKYYLNELAQIKTYYRNRNFTVKNDNMLVRLVKSLARDITLDVIEYFKYIDTDTPYTIKQFGIVSNSNKGKILDNVVFEGSSREVFVLTDNIIDIFDLEDNWRTYPSIKLIKSTLTDINYPVPFNYEINSLDLNIFTISPQAIMLQYYYWAKEKTAIGDGTAVNLFIQEVILLNITDSIIGVNLWNRLLSIMGVKDYYRDNGSRHPVNIINYTSKIDSVLEDIASDIKKKPMYIEQLLKTVPELTCLNSDVALHIDKTIYNKQSKWILWVSRLDYIVAIHRMLGKRGFRLNKRWYYKLVYEIKALKNRDADVATVLDIYNCLQLTENIKYVDKHIAVR